MKGSIKMEFKEIKQFTPVLIEWADSTADNIGWIDYTDVDETLYFVCSAGLFFSQTEEAVTIVQAYFEEEEEPKVSGVLTIPKVSIKKIVELEEK